MGYKKPYKKFIPKETAPKAPYVRAVRNWSEYQKAIFDAVQNGSGNYVVMARAGSGKTSTIIEALNYIPTGQSWILVAFNKKICEELKVQAPQDKNGEISTLHSLGYRAVMKAFGKVKLDNYKVKNMLVAKMGDDSETKREYVEKVVKAVSLCKGYLAMTADKIDEVIDRHGLDVGVNGERSSFISLVMQLLEQSAFEKKIIDFDDMIFMPVFFELDMPKFDMVFVDETQDLNSVQLKMIMGCRTSIGRIIAVGDDRQAIYGFRGADSNAIARIVSETNATVLPLSVTYRCAKSIVAIAQTIVPDIQAAPDAVEGEVVECSRETMCRDAAPGDFIISRSNAPLIGLAMGFIKAGKPAQIQGRDIGKNLLGFMKKSKCTQVDEFMNYVETWRDKEVTRLLAKNRDTTAVEDKAECFLALCEGAVDLNQVKLNIEKLFDDAELKGFILLMTIHKSKGLESNKCYVLADTCRPGKNVEESNLWYVACTRAKKSLNIVRGVK